LPPSAGAVSPSVRQISLYGLLSLASQNPLRTDGYAAAETTRQVLLLVADRQDQLDMVVAIF
jgi:hypothetical protein